MANDHKHERDIVRAAAYINKAPRTDEPKDDAGQELERDRKNRERLRKEWCRLKGRNRTWTPWLLLQHALYDVGLRPLADGVPHWISPAISVESSDSLGRAVAGEENYIHAKVFNLGMATSAPTRVDFYWADPSMGLGAGNMNLIGTEWVEVDNGSALDVRCNTPWVPTYLNDGHECLMVHCNNTMRDPMTHPFAPRLDRHVGQRNIQVIEAAAGAYFQLSLSVNNVLATAARVAITARTLHLAQRRGVKANARELINRAASFGAAQNTPDALLGLYKTATNEHRQAVALASWAQNHDLPEETLLVDVNGTQGHARASACVSGKWEEHRCFVKQPKGAAATAQVLVGDAKLARPLTSDDLVFAEAVLRPFEQNKLTVQLGVPSGAREGEFLVFHLAQRSEGRIVGGYTVVVRVTNANNREPT